GERKAVWLGALALNHPAYADLRVLAAALAAVTGASLGVLAEGGNAAGAYLAGAVPHREPGGKRAGRPGLDAAQMLGGGVGSFLLFGGVEPWAEPRVGMDALKALSAARLVIAITPYASEALCEIAHILLPIGTFVETSGTFVNLEGRWQSFMGAARPLGESRPGWKVLRVLGTELALPGFEYQSSEEVREELRRMCPAGQSNGMLPALESAHQVAAAGAGAPRVVDLPMYQVDAIVRRAGSLQRTAEGRAEPRIY
ncbi:MAG: molybdopterin-dependent oxidoreductase, partial [Steroidobacteraceae bacterium]